jgi:hypothetical protein
MIDFDDGVMFFSLLYNDYKDKKLKNIEGL